MIIHPLMVQPDPEDPQARECWLDVDLGVEVQQLLLDTGARRTRVSRTAAVEGLGVRSGADDSRSLTGAPSRAVGGEHVIVPGLGIGGAQLATGLAADLGSPALLGADAWQEHAVTFDFPAGELRLDVPARGGFPLELERPGPTPFVELRAPGCHTRACFDTGAGVTVVDLGFAVAHPDAFELLDDAPMPGTDAAGAAVAATRARLAPFRVGGVEFPATDVAVVDLARVNETAPWPLTVILGLPSIAEAAWWFDFAHDAWAVWREDVA